ncbi:MAG: hypothetical protein C4558_02665 [Dehalococcoidia bacterium]|nr:MAG: hypothetical protein C4558_02665 [Dehalococcoidia bacterium]
MRTAVRFLYAVAIALFLALTVGFGTLTFYPGPDRPEYPKEAELRVAPAPAATPATPDPKQIEAQRQYEEEYQRFQKDEKVHHRNVLLAVTGIAAVALLGGIAATAALDVLRAGIMLGALFSVIWALIYGANAAGRGAIFVAALVVLVLLAAVSTERVRGWLGRTLRLGSGDDLLR